MSEVLIILTNFSRPQNMPRVIQAWREQTVKCKIVVADNSPGVGVDHGSSSYYSQELEGADDVWRWTENSGCPCWIAPAVMLYGHRYVLRADDDLLPGKRAVEHLLNTAKMLNDEFTTIGQVGRKFSRWMTEVDMGYGYDRKNVPMGGLPVKVDLTCRASFFKAESAMWIPVFRQTLLTHRNTDPELAKKLVGIHDDFLLCMGVQTWTGQPSYVIPQLLDQETLLVKENLKNGPESVWQRPNHYEERDQMLQLCHQVGWNRV